MDKQTSPSHSTKSAGAQQTEEVLMVSSTGINPLKRAAVSDVDSPSYQKESDGKRLKSQSSSDSSSTCNNADDCLQTSKRPENHHVESLAIAECFGSGQFAAGNNLTMQSLDEQLAKLLKSLHVAKERRDVCEVEVVTGLKAYVKAKKDLHDANEICMYLYDTKGSQFRSFPTHQSSLSSLNELSNKLDKAQVHRRSCEMVEITVTESYLKSQLKLHEANKRFTDANHDMLSYVASLSLS